MSKISIEEKTNYQRFKDLSQAAHCESILASECDRKWSAAIANKILYRVGQILSQLDTQISEEKLHVLNDTCCVLNFV